jgi:hypothetical protein
MRDVPQQAAFHGVQAQDDADLLMMQFYYGGSLDRTGYLVDTSLLCADGQQKEQCSTTIECISMYIHLEKLSSVFWPAECSGLQFPPVYYERETLPRNVKSLQFLGSLLWR